MNIAVVDDEEAIREQIGGFIKKRNPDFDISSFAMGEGLLAAGKEFDMIFLDIQMEGMGGIEAARTLRQSGVDANIKSTAEKYYGTMDFKVNGRVFILSVMMKNERREEDGFRSDR